MEKHSWRTAYRSVGGEWKGMLKSWNLTLVLQSLTREPFKPMISAQMIDVSFKTIFLVAAATARRCSELGALTIAQDSFLERPQYIEIGYVPNFIPKNARVNYAGRTVVIPAFYIRRSARFQKEGERRLFVTFLSRWYPGARCFK